MNNLIPIQTLISPSSFIKILVPIISIAVLILFRRSILWASKKLRCYKDVYVNSFFPCTVRLWNSLPIECFPSIYDPSGFKSSINRHLLTVDSFSTDFWYAFMFLCIFFLWLNASYSVSLCIQSKCGKMQEKCGPE